MQDLSGPPTGGELDGERVGRGEPLALVVTDQGAIVPAVAVQSQQVDAALSCDPAGMVQQAPTDSPAGVGS